MKPDKDLVSLVTWVFILPGGLGLLLFYLEHEGLGDDIGALLALLSIMVVMAAPYHPLMFDKSEPGTSLKSIKRKTSASVGALTVAALMSFPGHTDQPSEFLDYGVGLGIVSLVSLGSFLLNILALKDRQSERRDFLLSASKACTGALATSIFLGSLHGLSAVQGFWLFVVVLGVFTNMLWSNSRVLAKARRKANPSERRLLRVLEHTSISLGFTAIIMLSAFNKAPTVADFLATAIIIGFGYWLFTRDREPCCHRTQYPTRDRSGA